MKKALLMSLACAFYLLSAKCLKAGGSGLNTLVVVNQASSNSCLLGNYYCERRGVPAANVLRINWQGNNISWTAQDFTTNLLNPISVALTSRKLTNQIDYVVLSMDIPFRTVYNGGDNNSTTSALFYGLKLDLGADPGVTNSYWASEDLFARSKPASAPGASYLTSMLTANTLAAAKAMIDQGVTADAFPPNAPALLAKSSDPLRNIRYPFFDNSILNTSLLGESSLQRTNSDDPSGLSGLLGYETGLMRFTISPNTFIPGAIADSMTSFGGVIFGPNDQTNLLAFISAGATGSYGTVAEPYADTQKFPDPMVYFYQARGFSLAECYYQSIKVPYLGLTVAEPLAAPFARSGTGSWDNGLSNSVLTGVAALNLMFSAHDSTRPLQEIALFVDGKYHRTLTNLPPTPNNKLSVSLNGYPISYTVPTNATVGTIATDISTLINNPVATNATQVHASGHGDRIELQYFATNHGSFPFYATNPPASVLTGITYRVAYLPETHPPRIIPTGTGGGGDFRMQLEIPTSLNFVVQASTNLAGWSPIFTNTVAGLIDFHDPESANLPRRFYRVVGPAPNLPPKITASGPMTGAGFPVRLESQPGQPCSLVASTNQQDWAAIATNESGGVWDFLDADAPIFSSRFYRGLLVTRTPPSLSLTNSTPSATLVRIDGALQPYTVEFQTNGSPWVGMVTNFNFRELQIAAGSSAGDARVLTTFLRCSRPTFLTSDVYGIRQYTFLSGTLSVGAWARFTITKTNNAVIVLGVTNQVAGISATNLAYQLCAMIKTNPVLQGSDGLAVEDYYVNGGGQTLFNLRARSPGVEAAQLGILPENSNFSTGVAIGPPFHRPLTGNLSDLQPRNHLYVTAGAGQIGGTFALDTTDLADGYHEFTAVAYEGSNVRTQTRATIPVCISNSPLSATLTLLDLTNNAPAQANYHIQVSANTSNVSLTTLYSTGGEIGSAAKNQTATFDVIGTNLCAGLHPFYAIVETFSGQTYRTQTSWIRLQ